VKIAVYSDLHLEFGDWTPPEVDCDLIILAGDIHTKAKGVTWATENFAQPVIYVAGNHEYYGGNVQSIDRKLQSTSEGSNVQVLQNCSTTIGDVKFIGATLWTDFLLNGDYQQAVANAKLSMQDYRSISWNDDSTYRRLYPHDTRALNSQSKQFIKDELAKTPVGLKKVVVTHHAPHFVCLNPKYAGDYLSPSFASDLGPILSDYEIDLWVCGHTHHCVDTVVHGTRIVSNQRGYYRVEPVLQFNENFVVTV